MSVQKVFENYLKDHLELRKECEGKCDGENDKCEKCQIIKAHRFLREKLKEYLSIMEEFESSGDEDIYSFLTGSYKRDTLIRPPKDVDFFIVLKEDDYKDFSPAEVLNLLHAVIVDIFPKKEEGEIRVKTHSITIDYTNEFGIDVIPAFEDGRNFRIPHVPQGGEEEWLVSNPRVHQKVVSEANEKSEGKLVPIIKLIKSWKRDKCVPENIDVKSFHLEMLAVKILGAGEVENYSSGLAKFFDESIQYLDEPCIPDPANPTNYIDGDLEDSDRTKLIELVSKDGEFAQAALSFEEEGEDDKAIVEWKKVFTSLSFKKSSDEVNLGTPLDVEYPVFQLGDYSHREPIPWPENLIYKAYIDAYLYSLDKSRMFRGINSDARFASDLSIKYIAKTNCPNSYKIYWQVVNTGNHATSLGIKGLRGQIFPKDDVGSTHIHWETSLYTGKHWIECFIVKDDTCITRRKFFVNIKNPNYH